MFAKDGYSTILKISVISLVSVLASHYFTDSLLINTIVSSLALFFVLFTLYFFRDPDRNSPKDENALISPADGKVIVVKPVDHHDYLGTGGTQISIFLSPLDVHINRVPATGTIEAARYFEGKYLVAWHEKASELNERSEFILKHRSGSRIFFNQITGYIARRITFHIKEGDNVNAGDKFGMMKFGSRMDIIVPDTVTLNVTEGQVVVGGETIIGQFK